MVLCSFRFYLRKGVKQELENKLGNNCPSTTPKKVKVMVELPFSMSQSSMIERWSDKRVGEYNAISKMSPVVIFFGGGYIGNFSISTSLHFPN